MIEEGEGAIRAELISLSIPSVIRLVAYVRIPTPAFRRVTRRAVLARDNYECQYCGVSANLTIDHVVPKSKGGESGWTNVVAACFPCNKLKQDFEPREVGLRLRRKPRTPRPGVFVLVETRTPPSSWSTYLG